MSSDPRRGWLRSSIRAEVLRLEGLAAKARARGYRLGEPYQAYCETLAACHDAAKLVYEAELASLCDEQIGASG